MKVTLIILTLIVLITPPKTWVWEKNPTVRFKIWICRGSGYLVQAGLWTLHTVLF